MHRNTAPQQLSLPKLTFLSLSLSSWIGVAFLAAMFLSETTVAREPVSYCQDTDSEFGNVQESTGESNSDQKSTESGDGQTENTSAAQDETADKAPSLFENLDKKIDEQFKPIADVSELVVFAQLPDRPLVLLLLIAGAAYFTLYFMFPNIRYFPIAIKTVLGKYDHLDGTGNSTKSGEVSHFQALTTAVSGTVGLGNISGVAIAIATGGPGATFWMIVCGLLGMSTKFVECTLGVAYREVDANGVVYGGPMYYLKKGFAERGKVVLGTVLAVVFAILCVGASLGGGNAYQANQAAKQISTTFNIDNGSTGFIIGLIMAVVAGTVIIGGIKSIARVTEKIVPFMGVLYVVACLIVILMNIQFLGIAVQQIIVEAFTPRAGLGGLVGVLMVGFQRAAFSNEAGAGSAAIAHSAVKTKYAASEGLVSLLEPFIDTVVVCTMTALVIVFFNLSNADVQGKALTFKTQETQASVMESFAADTENQNQVFIYGLKDDEGRSILRNQKGGLAGVELTSAAFGASISWFPYVLTVAIVLFAFSTMISWSYYGLQSWKFLFGRSLISDLSYKILFLAFIVIGASSELENILRFSDAMILALVFPNMIGLFLLAPRVREELNKYLAAIRNQK